MFRSTPTLLALWAVAAACSDRRAPAEQVAVAETAGAAVATRETAAEVYWDDAAAPSQDELERGRLDTAWHRFVDLDTTTPAPADTARAATTERWKSITPEAVNAVQVSFPLHGAVAGPSALKVQTLLDRALFSPGIMDGRWGKNSEKAVYWLQRREGLPATGRVDEATYNRLLELTGNPKEFVRSHTLTKDDVKGPFVTIPEDIYEKAKMKCMCYESLAEKLGETFHTSPALLEQLNPGVELNALQAGQTVQVPATRAADAPSAGEVAKLIVSDGAHYVHALDRDGNILYHFPSTLGSTYDPSPRGEFTVNSITRDPWWHYQPAILAHVDDSKPDATIPPGPNNAVGRVWMDLSVEHYGIHGTSAPETIGYATSAGCVRLTNWDVLFLSRFVKPGTPVEFRDAAADA